MKVTNCRLCKGSLSQPKIDLGSTPLANEFLNDQKPQDVFPLQVCVCKSCGHYQLNESVSPERLFRHYLYVAGTSPVNVEHFRKYASDMITKFDLKDGSKILDIASNDGTLLQAFKDLNMSVLGIDPAINLATEATDKGIETIPEFFTEEQANKILAKYGQFDLITANNVFAHVPEMIDFAEGVKKLLAPNGVFSFEVSYFPDVCDKNLFDTIYHEHSSYHTLGPLYSFFETHGMQLFDAERLSNHGGSVRIFVRRLEDKVSGRWAETQYCVLKYCQKNHFNIGEHHAIINRLVNLQEQEEYVYGKNIGEPVPPKELKMEEKVTKVQKDIKYLGLELREELRLLKLQGKSIAIYGVPAKATTLMYALGIDESLIDFAVDDAPLKQGTFTPGKHIPVLTTSAIFSRKPDVILVLAWNFAESIIQKCKKQWFEKFNNHRYPTFIVPLPELKIERYCENKTCTCGEGPWKRLHDKCGSSISVFQCNACGGIEYSRDK